MRVIEGRGMKFWPVRRSGPYRLTVFLDKDEMAALGRLASRLASGDRARVKSSCPDEEAAAASAVAQLHGTIRATALAEIRASFRVV